MAVGKLSIRTSHGDVVVIGHVAVVRRQLAEVVGRAANQCMAPVSWHSGSGGRVHRGPPRGPTDHGALG
jgi:hypothetical protein